MPCDACPQDVFAVCPICNESLADEAARNYAADIREAERARPEPPRERVVLREVSARLAKCALDEDVALDLYRDAKRSVGW